MLEHRQTAILSIARDRGRVSVEQLAELLDVSPQTVRRDLKVLCARGLLDRVHGGVILPLDLRIADTEAREADSAVDAAIAISLCAQSIPNGASIFVGNRVAAEPASRAFLNHSELIVATNNLGVANAFARNTAFEVVLVGGALRRSDSALLGATTVEDLTRLRVDYAILDASALDEDGSVYAADVVEATVSKAAIAAAGKTFIIVEGRECGRSASVRLANLEEIEGVFCVQAPSPGIVAACRQRRVAVKSAEGVTAQNGSRIPSLASALAIEPGRRASDD